MASVQSLNTRLSQFLWFAAIQRGKSTEALRMQNTCSKDLIVVPDNTIFMKGVPQSYPGVFLWLVIVGSSDINAAQTEGVWPD